MNSYEYRAIGRFLPYSPYKLRLLADVIRNNNAERALRFLSSLRNQRVMPVEKVLQSAIANARYANVEQVLDLKKIIIKEIVVDQGPMRRYMQPGAQGRSNVLRKRYCHIKVIVACRQLEHVQAKKSEEVK